MATRHAIALAAGECNNLLELADMLIAACKEVIEENKPPYKDPAVRLICFQIAFAGNGDYHIHQYYEDVYNFCVATVMQDQQGVPIKEKPVEPILPAS